MILPAMDFIMRSAPMRFRCSLAALVFATSVYAFPACAQMYKWVDANGVTNYSNERPDAAAVSGTVKQLEEDRLSVYSPDEALLQSVREGREQRRGEGKAASGQPKPAVSVIGAGTQPAPAPEPCATSPDCRAVDDAYLPIVVLPAQRRHHHHLRQPQLPAGATAGTLTGNSGIMPGNSAAAEAREPATTRSLPLRMR